MEHGTERGHILGGGKQPGITRHATVERAGQGVVYLPLFHHAVGLPFGRSDGRKACLFAVSDPTRLRSVDQLAALVRRAGQEVGVFHAQWDENVVGREGAERLSRNAFYDVLQRDVVQAAVLHV